MGWLSDAWDAVEETASDAWDAGVEAVEEFTEDVEDAWEDFEEDVNDAWSNFANQPGIFSFFAAVVGTFGSIVDLAFDVVGGIIGLVFGLIGAIIGLIVGVVVSIFSPSNGPGVGRAISDGLATFGNWIETFFDVLGNVVEWILGLIASSLLWIESWFHCNIGYVRTGQKPPVPSSFDDIQHVFVVMLENRSFDHLLGRVGVPKVDGWDTSNPNSNIDLNGDVIRQDVNAVQTLNANPPHEFSLIQLQLNAGRDTNGFAKVWNRHLLHENGAASPAEIQQVMAAFSTDRAPILNFLAAEFAVCDRWFASLPSATYPNRLFAYAGESGGLADSPRAAYLIGSNFDGISFRNGTFFDLLDRSCDRWRIYRGDATPMVNTLANVFISRMGDYRKINPSDSGDDEFAEDLAKAASQFPRFVLIEPNYGHFWSDFKDGNSQHPLDNIVNGERLIKHIYENLRASPIWEKSMLIITYDEHGGFYDHTVPPGTIAPGSDNRHVDLHGDINFNDYSAARYGGITLTNAELDPRKFQFDRLGVRVPAVVVSPLIPRSTVSGSCDQMVYDHTTIIRTYCDRFNRGFLANRDRQANSLRGLFGAGGVRETPMTLRPVNPA